MVVMTDQAMSRVVSSTGQKPRRGCVRKRGIYQQPFALIALQKLQHLIALALK